MTPSPGLGFKIPAATWPALAFAGPLFTHLVLFNLVFGGLGPEIADFRVKPPAAFAPGPETVARLTYALACAVFFLAAVPAFVYAIVTIANRRGRPAGYAVAVFALLVGLVTFTSDEWVGDHVEAGTGFGWLAWLSELVNSNRVSIGESLRNAVVEVPRMQVGAVLDPDREEHFMLIGALAGGVGTATTSALVLRFAEIAWPDRIGPELAGAAEVEDLHRRWQALRTTLLFGGLVLTLAVVATRSFYAWPLTFLDDDSVTLLTPIATFGSGFWGTLYTLTLVTAAMPVAIALNTRIAAVAADHVGPSVDDQRAWREANRLLLYPREVLSGVLAAATPLLASPAIEGLGRVLGGG
ncbi:MAG: hypothetical protein AAF899_06570 [Pseudomonadota bacterium]